MFRDIFNKVVKSWPLASETSVPLKRAIAPVANSPRGGRSHVVALLKPQRAAMFGLDARIALAIVSSISLVTGYVLYDSYRTSRVKAQIVEFQQIADAYKNLVLDTRQDVGRFSDLYGDSSGLHRWDGPYIDVNTVSSRDYGSYRIYSLYNRADSLPGATGCANDYGQPQSLITPPADDCAMWLYIDPIPLDTATKMDMLVDGTYDPSNGNLKYNEASGILAYYISARIR